MTHSISLNRLQFLEKIYNYERDPSGWKYLGALPGVLIFHSHINKFCTELQPAVEIIAKRGKGKYHVYTIDTDTEKELSRNLMIDNIPTFYLCPVKGVPTIIKGTINIREIKKLIDKTF